MESQERSQLKKILIQKSLTFGDVKLFSGEKSNVYVDGKITTCFPPAMPLIGRLFLAKIRAQGWLPEAVGGLTVGADPIAFSIARESLDQPYLMINSFIVRKAAKEHGKNKSVEGLERTEGLRVVIIDDVCTKGGSTGTAIDKAREAGMNVLGAACLVDRQQGASELLREKYRVELISIFTLQELVYEHELDYANQHQSAPAV